MLLHAEKQDKPGCRDRAEFPSNKVFSISVVPMDEVSITSKHRFGLVD
jgi:hypothetical protein